MPSYPPPPYPFPSSLRALLLALLTCCQGASGLAAGAGEPEAAPEWYVVNYPAASVFVTPTRTTFEDAVRVVVKPGVNQHPNGGYGKAMLRVGGIDLFHTGADLSWFRIGSPVYAVADGVVRLSLPPQIAELRQAGVKVPRAAMDWGNLIVIEHRLPEGGEFLTIYAHLGNDRRVHAGDIVAAGQVIGSIGRKSAKVNGGYEPHLHFGIREGTLLTKGAPLFGVPLDGRPAIVRLDEPGERTATVQMPEGTPDVWGVTLHGKPVTVEKMDGRYELPASVLWNAVPPGTVVGYAPRLDGWVDPLAFLNRHRAAGMRASRLEPTWVTRDEPLANVVGQVAEPWRVDEWLKAPAAGGEVADLRGRIVCLFCIQAACRASRSHALPAAAEVARHYGPDAGVQVVVLHTPVRESRRNTRQHLEALARGLPASVAVGDCAPGQDAGPAILDEYAIRCTPWLVLIDGEGRVRLSGIHVRAEACVEFIDALKAEAA